LAKFYKAILFSLREKKDILKFWIPRNFRWPIFMIFSSFGPWGMYLGLSKADFRGFQNRA